MIDSDTFRSVLGRFASGVTIVTARDEHGQDHGMTVSAFCSLSLNPPRILVCIDHAASMFHVLKDGVVFGISILASPQEAYSRRFADPDAERFDGIAYSRGESGVVLLNDSLAHLECRIVEHHDAGDHTIFVAEVERGAPSDGGGRPLLYYRGGYAQLER
jgi:flavin reductase (DIM6/NTAB) family NADH-FMN oxidoreductase RutF